MSFKWSEDLNKFSMFDEAGDVFNTAGLFKIIEIPANGIEVQNKESDQRDCFEAISSDEDETKMVQQYQEMQKYQMMQKYQKMQMQYQMVQQQMIQQQQLIEEERLMQKVKTEKTTDLLPEKTTCGKYGKL